MHMGERFDPAVTGVKLKVLRSKVKAYWVGKNIQSINHLINQSNNQYLTHVKHLR